MGKRDASDNHIFDRIKANLAEIQSTNHQNVQKTHFLQKAPGVNELKNNFFLPVQITCSMLLN